MNNEKESLTLDQLDAVSDGVRISDGIKISGGVSYKRPANCPACGAELMWTRNSVKTVCMKCETEVQAVASSGNPTYEG